MEFTQEQIEKARNAKTSEELLTIAKENSIDISEEQSKKYFEMLNVKEGKIPEDELENVVGGTCYSSGVWGPEGFQKYAIVTALNQCRFQTKKFYPCAICEKSFKCGATLYCSIRTKDNDPYK